MRVRIKDPVHGRQFGHGQNDFYVNTPAGPAQCVQTRLGLWKGQWFLNTDDGMDWLGKVLGKYTGSTRDVAIQARIVSTPGITEIVSYSSSLNRNTRKWTVNATLKTAYGQTTFTGNV